MTEPRTPQLTVPGPGNGGDAPDGVGPPDRAGAPGRAGGGRLGLWLGAVPAIAGVLLTVAAMTLGKLLVFGLLAAATVPLTVVSLRPAWAWLKYALACALTVALVGFALTVVYYQGRPGKPAVPAAPPPVSLKDSAQGLKFLPVTGPVSHCVSFAGTGRIPDGDALVVLDRPTDSGGRYTPTSTFSFDGEAAASPSGRGWIVPDLNLGAGEPSDKGTHMAVLTVLMPENVAGFLDTLNSDSETGAVPADVTKLGAEADRLVVVRNGENAHC
ncbi:hypothetical protein [Streptomyces sp. 8L]|uniref:hypothetical protein n=1 Tax=Streptomyces sp. 8L TaxID=2877242 RepID=UPI001CD4BA9C|nr:hypothetical protein [Streptomyces sp. 8L]MCA1219745.1 hypothetical protein [Streptomyces sp. 8L]